MQPFIGVRQSLFLLVGLGAIFSNLRADDQPMPTGETPVPSTAADGGTPTVATVKSDESDAASESNESTQSPAYTLAYKFKPNQLVHYKVSHKAMIRTQTAEASETVRSRTVTRQHFRVVSVDTDGTGVLEPVIDRVELFVQFDDAKPTQWNSASGTPPPSKYKDIAKTLGKPLARFKYAANGKLLSVSPLELGRRIGVGRLPTGNGVPADDPSQNFLVVFPELPIRIGESWTEKIDVQVTVGRKLKLPIKLRREYRLKSVADDLATISLKTVVLTPVRDPNIRGQLIQRTPSGTIVFDLATGRLISRKLSIDRTEIGPAGLKSLMRATSERIERLISSRVAARGPVGPSLPK